MDTASRRVTRRQARESRRMTHRQRGGSAIIDPIPFKPANVSNGFKTLFEGQLPDDLQFLVSSTTPPADDEKAKHYFTIIQQQDVITRALLRVIYTTAGLPVDNPEPDTIISQWQTEIQSRPDKMNAILSLLTYVRNLFLLKIGDTAATGITGISSNTRPKLDDLLFTETSGRLSGAPLAGEILELMLYPRRLENIFVTSVAMIIQNLLTDDSALRTVTTAPDSSTKTRLIELLATQYAAYINSVSFTTTNRETRDSFSAMSKKPTIVEMISFFKEFLTEINTTPDSRLTPSITPGKLAGIIYKQCKSSGIANITDRILEMTTAAPPGRPARTVADDRDKYGLPDAIYDTVDLGNKVTFGGIYTAIGKDAEKLHFLLHLLYTLEHPETEAATSTT
jgi:hypothetical protein